MSNLNVFHQVAEYAIGVRSVESVNAKNGLLPVVLLLGLWLSIHVPHDRLWQGVHLCCTLNPPILNYTLNLEQSKDGITLGSTMFLTLLEMALDLVGPQALDRST